ncbi:MAG: hypothetical protein EBY07_16115 [Actinobacteria bacterium]|nr:hypothetical protein [Actinomycetota bacterium]
MLESFTLPLPPPPPPIAAVCPVIFELLPLPPNVLVPAVPPPPTVTVYAVEIDMLAVPYNKPPAPPPPPASDPPPPPPPATIRYSTVYVLPVLNAYQVASPP